MSKKNNIIKPLRLAWIILGLRSRYDCVSLGAALQKECRQ